ncbi:MAG: hypothetical protein M0P71_01165 [Melioribacteraceae bacterium]|nr:hypothetical protein [Melioribacteraceae bacterium]
MKSKNVNTKIVGAISFPNKSATNGILVKKDGELKPTVLNDGLIVINNGTINTVSTQ